MNAELETTAKIASNATARASSPTPTGNVGFGGEGSARIGGGTHPSTTGAAKAGAAKAAGVAGKVGAAGKVGVALKGVAVAGTAVAGYALAVHAGVAPGISVAISHVPVWTHAHAVLTALAQRLGLGGRGSVNLGL
jgi:hypothetical protein